MNLRIIYQNKESICFAFEFDIIESHKIVVRQQQKYVFRVSLNVLKLHKTTRNGK